ncbi:MAG: site-specific DNA-methyltransferase [Variibacter sp.]
MSISPQPRRPRLELTWVGKEARQPLEARIFREDAALGCFAVRSRSGSALSDNRLIFGDNLLALKALEQDFAGRVKCTFIDPPYNTGSAFAQYDDGLEHSLWLSLIRDRLEIIHGLLSFDGSLWISIDDNEAHYLKVLCDEIFGRANFVANVVWQKRTSSDARLRLGDAHDHILVYAKDRARLALNKISPSADQLKGYKNPDNDPRGAWASSDFTAQGWRPNQMYAIKTPGGARFEPPPARCWANIEAVFEALKADGRIWFGKQQRSRPRVKTFLREHEGISAWSWWPHHEVGHNQEAKKESIALFGADDAFATPKPERLVRRILEIATNPGDLVLDSFAGSGTTGAVAHKMGRRWIMVELGEHCHTHIIPRLKKVVSGEDQGGISEAVGWKGGGGFRYFRLAPPLLRLDANGREVINTADYNPEMLAEALCKLKAFRYAPSPTVYWQQGYSTERDFIYVTTQTLNHQQLAALSEEVGPDRTLLVLCLAFRGNAAAFANLTVQKIPETIRKQCEFARSDYSHDVVSRVRQSATRTRVAAVSAKTQRRRSPKVTVKPKMAKRRRGART